MATLLYAWGRGDDGQIGVGDTGDQLLPIAIEHLRKEHVVCVVCGSGHTVALTKQGRIWTWGRGDDGRLGHGDHGWKYIPRLVESLVPMEAIRVISSGSYHSAAVSASGTVYTWGGGLFGKLGLGNESGRLSPARVDGLQGKVVINLACGSRHTCALTSQGEVYSWGDHENGVTGHGTTENHQYSPRLINALRGCNIISIGACGFHSGAVTAEGEVYTFGEGKFGRLGHGSETNCLIPRPIEALRGKRVTIFAAGGFHTCCVTDTGHLYTFGGGEHGQLGHGDRVNRNSPTLVEALLGHVVTQISTGWSHNVCLCENEVYSWGNGDHGKLGHGDTFLVTIPRLIERFRGMRVIQVASYNEHTAALVALSNDPIITSTNLPLGPHNIEDSETRYLQDFRNMFIDGRFSDVTFILENRRIPAHRAILAARSEHFSSMFLSGMRESLETEICIPNVRFRIFNALLEFLYTNKVQGLSGEDAVELYVLADLYQIDDLKILCKDLVIHSLTLQSVPSLFVSTHTFGISELHDVCLSYMVRHFDVVSKTREFGEMSKELVLEVVQKRAPLSPVSFNGY